MAFFEGAQYLDEPVPTLDQLTEGSEGFNHLRVSITDHGGVTAEVGSDGTFKIEAPGDGRAALCYTGAEHGTFADVDSQRAEVSVPGCRLVDPAEAPRLRIQVGSTFNISVAD